MGSTMLFYSMYNSLDKAIDAYAGERNHDIDDERSFWLHETYCDVFPADTAKRIKERINEIRRQVPRKLAYNLSMDVFHAFEPFWRTLGEDKQERLEKKVISDITESVTNFIATRVEDDPLIASLTVRLPEILQRKGQSKTKDVLDAIKDELNSYFENQESLFMELPVASEKNPVDLAVPELIIEHGYLQRLLRTAKLQPTEVFDLEPFLIEELRQDGCKPVDFLRCKDMSARSRWKVKARKRQKGSAETLQEFRIVEPSITFEPPDFLLCTYDQWFRLMNSLAFEFDRQEGKYIWTRPWRVARWFIDIAASKMAGMRVIDRTHQTYGSIFIGLFWKDCNFIRDVKKVSRELTRPRNHMSRKIQPDDPELDKVFRKVFSPSNS